MSLENLTEFEKDNLTQGFYSVKVPYLDCKTLGKINDRQRWEYYDLEKDCFRPVSAEDVTVCTKLMHLKF